jgi:hypothetical protein
MVPSDDGMLMVKDFLGKSVDLRWMFGADTLSKRPDAHDRRQKPEQTSCLSSKLIRRRMIEIRVFRSIGVVFSLTNEGHIDVGL